MTETTNFIILGILLSIVLGLILGYFLILIKKRSQTKNSIKRIEKQKMKYRIGGRKYNFTGGDDDGLEKVIPSVPSKAAKIPKPTEIKPKKPKAKKKSKRGKKK